MKTPKILFFYAISLVLSGCNLDVTIEGEGRVFSPDGRVDCSASCRDTNRGNPISTRLNAQAADGFTFLGFMPDGDATSLVSYGFALILPDPFGGPVRYFQSFSASVLAVFFPTDQIAQRESSGRSTCVVDTQNHMSCWGEGAKWHPDGLDNVSQLTLSENTFCAYYDNRISCWNDANPFPADAPENVINPIATASNTHSTCILYQPGAQNAIHCLGSSAPLPAFDNPTAIWSDGDDIYCATDSNGSRCWGDNYYGQSQMPANLGNVSDFATGATHTCAIASGQVQCWGNNQYGQLDVPDDLINPTTIVAGTDQTCVIDNGELRCWGAGNDIREPLQAPELFDPKLMSLRHVILGLIDPGRTPSLIYPIAGTGVATPSLGTITALTTGVNIVCAISDGQLVCWGLADVTEQNLALTGNPYDIAAYNDLICAATSAGVQCFSERDNYNLKTPPSGLTQPSDMAFSSFHGCAVQNGTVVCWGDGAATGEVNDVARGQGDVPVGLGTVTKVDVGKYHSCALGDDQTLHCWGEKPIPKG